MKKVILSAFTLFTVATISANAQTAAQTTPGTQGGTQSTTQTNTPATENETKTAVTVEELPAAVKATLASQTLKAWTPTDAFLVKAADGKEYYAINLKKENETGSVTLDKEGKPVK